MIETIILNYLSDTLDVPVFFEQKNNSGSFVIVQKTGGGYRNFLYTDTFAIQSYADTKFESSLLNEKVKKAMLNIIVLDDISKIILNSDYDFTETQTKRYRYQAVFDIIHF